MLFLCTPARDLANAEEGVNVERRNGRKKINANKCFVLIPFVGVGRVKIGRKLGLNELELFDCKQEPRQWPSCFTKCMVRYICEPEKTRNTHEHTQHTHTHTHTKKHTHTNARACIGVPKCRHNALLDGVTCKSWACVQGRGH